MLQSYILLYHNGTQLLLLLKIVSTKIQLECAVMQLLNNSSDKNPTQQSRVDFELCSVELIDQISLHNICISASKKRRLIEKSVSSLFQTNLPPFGGKRLALYQCFRLPGSQSRCQLQFFCF